MHCQRLYFSRKATLSLLAERRYLPALHQPPSHQILSTVGRISKVQDRVLKGLRITSHALSIGSVSICQLYCFPNLGECPTSRSLHTYRYPWAVGSSQDLPSR